MNKDHGDEPDDENENEPEIQRNECLYGHVLSSLMWKEVQELQKQHSLQNHQEIQRGQWGRDRPR